MPKIERSSSLVSTPKVQSAQSVSRPSAPTAPAAPTAPVTEYAGQAAPRKDLLPKGANLAKTASVNALWGDAPRQVNLDQDAFKALAPADQQKLVEAAKAEQAQLGQDINQRVEVLDKKWNNSRLSTRTEALREYQERGGGRRLGRRQREKLDGLVTRSEEAQRKINVLRAKIDALPRTPEAKKEMAELRNELARELRRARDEQSKVVKEATAVVDAEGLKVDRLAVTEQIIDPSAPPAGSGQSLLEKIARFLHLDQFFSFVQELTTDFFATQIDQRVEQNQERREREFFDRIRTLAQQQSDVRLRDQLKVVDSAPAVSEA
jgi:hypothetical protein